MILRNCTICNAEYSVSHASNHRKTCKKHTNKSSKYYKEVDGVLLKKCTKCLEWLKCDKFYQSTNKKNHLSGDCKVCRQIRRNKYENERIRRLYTQRKLDLIENKGGKCCKCGYCKNLSALVFHHLDPDKKDFGLSTKNLTKSDLSVIQREADKCILLCENCHREEHNPHLDMNVIKFNI